MIRWAQKALTAMKFSGQLPFLLGRLARTRFDYRKEVGLGIDSSVVTAPVQFVQRAFPEARLRVMRGNGDDKAEIENHPMVQLITRPNPFYDDDVLWAATLLSYYTDGNAYWLKVRDGNRKVVELWYVPHWTIRPRWPSDGSGFISHYQYRPGGSSIEEIDTDDVVHFRHGVDPRNIRLGLSPMHGVIREIFTDLEASNFAASLLRNMGVPGMVISPSTGAVVEHDDIQAVKKRLRESFGGDKRGEPLVMGAPTEVKEYGFTPQQMDMSAVRNVAEERVAASIGIPAAVIGFGAGLQTAKVGATMKELRALAWTNGIVPVQRAMAGQVDRSLLPDFGGRGRKDGGDLETGFDTSEVGALADERLTNAQAWDTMVKGGWAEVAEGRSAMGLDVDDSHRIFLRPFSAIEVAAGAPPREAAPVESSHRTALTGKKQTQEERRHAAERYAMALERMEQPLADLMNAKLVPFFQDLGALAASVAVPFLQEEFFEDVGTASAEEGEAKEAKQDDVLVGLIMDQLELPLHQTTFKQIYEAHYLQVAREVAAAGDLVGLATDLPDPVARAVTAAGGRRSGLVDLTAQSREALFDALAEGRAEGEGVDQLAQRIADHVEGGPWKTADTRARTIARTETKYAQNVSTIARAQHEGVDQFIIFDGRLGHGRSTPSHIARDGLIVSADEASQMAAAEHPNGTLSFSPHFGES